MTAAGESRRRLVDALTPVVVDLGFDLEDVQVSTIGRRSVVRVVVDGDSGVDLDSVAEVSRALSDVLDGDREAGFSGPYVLEVSSPGVDRPLTEPRHWRRSVGRLVQVQVDGQPVTARVEGVEESGVRLDFAGRSRVVDWPSLGEGRVQIEFNRKGSAADVEGEPYDFEGGEA